MLTSAEFICFLGRTVTESLYVENVNQKCNSVEESVFFLSSELTFHVHVSDGAQQAHVIVIVVRVEARVVEDLQRSVAFPRRALCDADRAHHHQPVGHFQHVVPIRKR